MEAKASAGKVESGHLSHVTMPENRAAHRSTSEILANRVPAASLPRRSMYFSSGVPGVKLTRTFDIGDFVIYVLSTVTTTIGPETQWRVDARNPMSTGEAQPWR